MKLKTIKYRYLITMEDGQHFLTNEYTSAEVEALQEGILTIIRLEDGHDLNPDGSWSELPEWGNW